MSLGSRTSQARFRPGPVCCSHSVKVGGAAATWTTPPSARSQASRNVLWDDPGETGHRLTAEGPTLTCPFLLSEYVNTHLKKSHPRGH